MAAKNPLIIEVTRGTMVESRHRGAAVVMDAKGKAVHAWGEIERIVCPRSAIKPLQALAVVETGAAEAFGVTDAELALASASHGGQAEHTDAVLAWLERIGLGSEDLECGVHEPLDAETAKEKARAGRKPGPADNNCSGKHAGMLTTAKHLGEETAGYTRPGHPVQQRLRTILTDMGGEGLSQAPEGTDGCGIPVFGMPLSAMARALARMADTGGFEAGRAEAAGRIVAAMTANPMLVGGRGRFDTIAMEAANGAFAVKTGAEGVHGAILPGLGLGVAVKIDDGARRAAQVAMAAVLDHLGVLDDKAKTALAAFLETPVLNARGERVGEIRMANGWAG
ncbi:MAG: L-asparaginase II [Rhodospirillaceae bacterium]|jgi:L-asparaginase II|nr:L-asparaginase II [Rhodospirillaceae bacterium]